MNSSGSIGLGNGCFGMNAFGKRPASTFDEIDANLIVADQIKVKKLKIGYPTDATSYDMPESKGNNGDVLTTNVSGDAVWVPPGVIGASYETVIFRPGVPSSLNIVATWAEVIPFVNNGAVTIYVDDSIAPATIDVDADLLARVSISPYDLDAATVPNLVFAPDVQITNLKALDGPISLLLNSATRPNLIFSPGQIFVIINGALLLQTALSAVSACVIDGILIVSMSQGSHVETLGQPIFEITGTDSMILVQLLNTGQPSGMDWVIGPIGSGLTNIRDASAQDLVFSGFFGTRQNFNIDQAKGVFYDDSAILPLTAQNNVQDILDYLKQGNFDSLKLREGGVPRWEMKSTGGGEMWTSSLPSDTRILRLLPEYPSGGDPALFQLGEAAGCNMAVYGYLDNLNRHFISRADDTTGIDFRFRNAALPQDTWAFTMNPADPNLYLTYEDNFPNPAVTFKSLGPVYVPQLQTGNNGNEYQFPGTRGNPGEVLTATGSGLFTTWAPTSAGPAKRFLSAYIFVSNIGITAFPGPGVTTELINTGGVFAQNGTNNIAEWILGLQSIGYVGAPTINALVTVSFDAITAGTANQTRVWSLSKNFVLIPASYVRTQVGIRSSYFLQAYMSLSTNDTITVRVTNEDGNLTGVVVSQMSMVVIEF